MADIEKQVADRFPKDVAEFSVKIELDNGVHRHLYCSNNGSCTNHFRVVTFPGYLVIVGDMGSYTFWRTEDMFTFFRGEDIDLGYWLEKCEAQDRRCGSSHFSADEFHAAVKRCARESIELDDADELPDSATDELSELLEADSEFDCQHAYLNYHGDLLNDFWEMGPFTEPSYHLVWCMHAIVWAIAKYDEMKTQKEVSGE